MHILYFVKKPKEENDTSYSVRNNTYNYLADEGFISTGYFGGGKGDWFVIGGRWSGILKQLQNEGNFKRDETHNPYKSEGHEDDAMMLTKELYQALTQGKYKDEVECFDSDDHEEGYIKQILKVEDIGKVWIIVVDYHY